MNNTYFEVKEVKEKSNTTNDKNRTVSAKSVIDGVMTDSFDYKIETVHDNHNPFSGKEVSKKYRVFSSDDLLYEDTVHFCNELKDEHGRVTIKEIVDPKDHGVSIITYSYDSKGKVKTETFVNKHGFKLVRKYNTDGYLISAIIYAPGSTTDKIVALRTTKLEPINGVNLNLEIAKNDSLINRIKADGFKDFNDFNVKDGDVIVVRYVEFFRNDLKHPLKETVITNDGETRSEVEYLYEDNRKANYGLWTKKDTDSGKIVEKREYDENGNLVNSYTIDHYEHEIISVTCDRYKKEGAYRTDKVLTNFNTTSGELFSITSGEEIYPDKTLLWSRHSYDDSTLYNEIRYNENHQTISKKEFYVSDISTEECVTHEEFFTWFGNNTESDFEVESTDYDWYGDKKYATSTKYEKKETLKDGDIERYTTIKRAFAPDTSGFFPDRIVNDLMKRFKEKYSNYKK